MTSPDRAIDSGVAETCWFSGFDHGWCGFVLDHFGRRDDGFVVDMGMDGGGVGFVHHRRRGRVCYRWRGRGFHVRQWHIWHRYCFAFAFTPRWLYNPFCDDLRSSCLLGVVWFAIIARCLSTLLCWASMLHHVCLRCSFRVRAGAFVGLKRRADWLVLQLMTLGRYGADDCESRGKRVCVDDLGCWFSHLRLCFSAMQYCDGRALCDNSC